LEFYERTKPKLVKKKSIKKTWLIINMVNNIATPIASSLCLQMGLIYHHLSDKIACPVNDARQETKMSLF